MSSGGAERSETGIVAMMGIFFLFLVSLCCLEWANDGAKTGWQNSGGGNH
jgi:hypothetical protein